MVHIESSMETLEIFYQTAFEIFDAMFGLAAGPPFNRSLLSLEETRRAATFGAAKE